MTIITSYDLDRGWFAQITKPTGYKAPEFRTVIYDEDGQQIHINIGNWSEAECNSFIVGWFNGHQSGVAEGKRTNAQQVAHTLQALLHPDED